MTKNPYHSITEKMYTLTGTDWSVSASVILTEPVCPVVSLYPDDDKTWHSVRGVLGREGDINNSINLALGIWQERFEKGLLKKTKEELAAAPPGYYIGDAVWIHLGGIHNPLVKGTIVDTREVSRFGLQYIIEINTSIESFLEIRDWWTISDTPEGPINAFRVIGNENVKISGE